MRKVSQFVAAMATIVAGYVLIDMAEGRYLKPQAKASEFLVEQVKNENLQRVQYTPKEQAVLNILENRKNEEQRTRRILEGTKQEQLALTILENRSEEKRSQAILEGRVPKAVAKPQPKPKPQPKQQVVKDTKPKALPQKTKPKLEFKRKSEVLCLAEAMFYEAQAEKVSGKIGVADTILNRTRSICFPDTVCGVISQPKQFQWKRNTKLRKGRVFNPVKHEVEVMLAERLLKDEANGHRRDTTGGALYFAAHGYNPSRNARFIKTEGGHKFYRHDNRRVKCA